MRSVVAVLAALLVAGTQLPADAAGWFAVNDPAGDAIGHGDLSRLTLSTAGARHGHPQSLVLQLQLADAVDRSGTTRYEVDLSFPGCSGGFRATVNPGVPAAHHVSCQLRPDDLTFTMDIAPAVRGSVLTWVVAFDAFPAGAVSAGQVAHHVRAFTALELDDSAPDAIHNDDLSTTAAYTIR